MPASPEAGLGVSAAPDDRPAPPSTRLDDLYAGSLALLTDFYEITMAYGYYAGGNPEREAVFTLSFRRSPFAGGYAVACGIQAVLDFLERFRVTDDDAEYLGTLLGRDGEPLFTRPFLRYLRDVRFRCDVDAVPEGTVVFPYEPIVRVTGPILQAQLVESALLNLVNFETLIATKASRVVSAAAGDPVLEFGLRRAQGIDGSLSASRAAYVGGCHATSNVLAGKRYGIPVSGTHAHSWVMSFDDEQEAFDAYAEALPGNVVLLVDTFDTLEGVRHAIRTGRRLRAKGHQLAGIRLDSGDLAYLSIEARRLLDEAGFDDAVVYASNDLDEALIENLKMQGARIGAWGVGTRLVTGGDQAALGGTYKLGALRAADGSWQPRVKLSEETEKTSVPGRLQVRRYRTADGFVGDLIYDEDHRPGPAPLAIDPVDPTRRRRFEPHEAGEDLLLPVLRDGRRVTQREPLAAARDRTREQLAALHPAIRRFANPHRYPAGLEESLHERRTRLILEARQRD
jgi:nicotinate phosphoribosyltransferase